jgi:hypothetical protein
MGSRTKEEQSEHTLDTFKGILHNSPDDMWFPKKYLIDSVEVGEDLLTSLKTTQHELIKTQNKLLLVERDFYFLSKLVVFFAFVCFFLLFFYTRAVAQSVYTELGPIIHSTVNSAIGEAANGIVTGHFDGKRVVDSMVYSGAGVLQNRSWKNYDNHVREQHQQEYEEREYQVWAEQRDRERGINTREQRYRERYARERGLDYVP